MRGILDECPCKDCQLRKIGCHDSSESCRRPEGETYAEWRVLYEAAQKSYNKERDDQIRADSYEKERSLKNKIKYRRIK
jgi:hypothetical protein